MKDRRYKLTKACEDSFRQILQRPSKDGEIQAHHVASFQAHMRHIVDVMYPSQYFTGEVLSFGSDDGNQLGLCTDPEAEKEDEYVPSLIPPQNLPSYNVKAIAAGGSSSFALTYDGTVYSWGVNDEGQLGRGDIPSEQLHTIGKVPLDDTIIQVSAGNTHTLFLDMDGTVFVAGQYYTQEYGKWMDRNTLQELEQAQKEGKPNLLPYQLTTFSQKVIKVAAGNNFSAALLEDGCTLVTWGLAMDGQLARSRSGGAPPVDAPKDGQQHRSFDYEKPMLGEYKNVFDDKKKTNVQVFETKNDMVFKNFLTPKAVDWEDSLNRTVRRHIVDFACGDRHLLVVARDDGSFETRVYSAGFNVGGQLGQGDLEPCHFLSPIRFLDKKRICKVATGLHHSLALNMLGDNVWAWGNSNNSSLGLGPEDAPRPVPTPQLVSFPKSIQGERIVDISAGDSTNFVITDKYNIYSWGFNVNGQAGINSDVMDIVERPRKFDPMETVQRRYNPEATKGWVLQVAAGGQHTLLLVKRFK
ncbi:RCC1 repeat-containing protein [Nitzschia inconspicua]|uniref:RCC1 repeat-containing protein n=1 Tax=Nitzschia inconspicua TaxID=303405 RepID=A0A9K3K515_9STRA|nr:RCC1 repeat-containing protein [Nitzschia inconspicua]